LIAAAGGVVAALAAADAPVPGEWRFMPPRDVDPALANTENPIPRRWSGQKAALAFARVEASSAVPIEGVSGVSTPSGRIAVSWADAAAARRAPGLRPDPTSLWQKAKGPKPPITEPRLYFAAADLRLFSGSGVPPCTDDLLPFVVLVDGNNEDGYGGFVLGADAASAKFSASPDGVCVESPGARAFVLRFDGNWVAGFKALADSLARFPTLAARLESCRRSAFGDGQLSPDLALAFAVVGEWCFDDGKWNAAKDGWREWFKGRVERRAGLLSDPHLAATLDGGILFCSRRNPSWNHCVAQYFGWRQRPGGSIRILEKPGVSMKTRDLTAGRMPEGNFLEPRLSYDAKRVMFSFVETTGPLDPYSMKVNEEGGDDHYYHLWTMGVDGSGLRQVTRGVYEDMMPCWLPDGDVAFMSTRRRSQSRCFWFGYSNRWQAYTLFRMKPDGSDIRQLSWNDVAEWFPTMSANGEIIFARWDYIDRDAVRHQNLWSMRPDGTNPKAIWGNETPDPHCTFQPRAVPGSGKIACIASAHHAVTGGPLILVDPSVDENSERAVTHVTPGHYPEIDVPEGGGYKSRTPVPKGPGYTSNEWYNSPWPYGEDLFLVSYSRDPLQYEPTRPIPDAALGLYILSADGRRELLYRDGVFGACSAEPIVPRNPPPVWKTQCDAALAREAKGEVFISDVYRGLPKAVRGSLKEVRVVQIFPRTSPDQYLPLCGAGGHENARAVLGTARIEPDGSARFFVPAEKAVLFQVLDSDGFAWRTMRSTTSLMRGERVSCVGCHEAKYEVSATAAAARLAMKRPAEELKVPPEGGRPWGFMENVQPIFDRKCVSCHGDENPAGDLALTRTPDPRFGHQKLNGRASEFGKNLVSAPFSRSFAELSFAPTKESYKGFPQSYVPFKLYKRRMQKSKDGPELPMVPIWPEYNQQQTTPEGPSVNALGSGLMRKLSRGKHAARVTPEERRMIATWIDLNATFYGCCDEPWLSRQFKGEPIPMPERQ
jgi:mono/diheme cytochrome c family protein